MLSDEGYSAFDKGRWAPKPPESKSCTAFGCDRARLIHSSTLRRLGAKNRVLIASTDDFARTRPAHTLGVAQIGRQIDALFDCDPDVVGCACLAHGPGHSPLEHSEERTLTNITSNIDGFKGDAQTVYILTRLKPRIFHPDGHSAGVDLTRTALDTAVKYPWTLTEVDRHPKGKRSKEFCVYPDDEPVLRWLKTGTSQTVKPTECQIMNLSDDIVYPVHDVEDSITAGTLDSIVFTNPEMLGHIIEQTCTWYGAEWNTDKLLAAFMRLHREYLFPTHFNGSRKSLVQLKDVASDLIGHFCWSVEAATCDTCRPGSSTRYSSNIVIPENANYEIMTLKGIVVYFVMASHEREPSH